MIDLNNTFLVVDCETGGLEPGKHSLLSVAGVVWSPDIQPTELFNFYIHEENLNVSKSALEVNKINLNKVILEGFSPKSATNIITESIVRFFAKELNIVIDNKNTITLAGHNVGFDISFLKRLWRLGVPGENSFPSFFSHRSLDTSSISKFLQMIGHFPEGKASSDALFDYCGVQIPAEMRHTALGDAMGTAQSLDFLYRKFKVVRI